MSHQQEPTPIFDADAEFGRQVQTLLDTGYAHESRMTARDFVAMVEPLRGIAVSACRESKGPTNERVPFVLVVTKALVPAERAMPLTTHKGKPRFVSADTTDIGRFGAIEAVEVPDGDAYVAIDVPRGEEYLDVRPDDAVAALPARGRTPPTVDAHLARDGVLQRPGRSPERHLAGFTTPRPSTGRICPDPPGS